LLGQIHSKVKAFKTSLETGDLATISYKSETVSGGGKHLSDTGGEEESAAKDRRIRELEAEVARLRDRERQLMEHIKANDFK
jgi:hypothetical protein